MGEDILLGPLVLFACAMCLTPGPNVVMVTASAANFGFHRAIPQILGITLGFGLLVMAAGLGLAGLFQTEPRLHMLLKYAGAAYLVYLAAVIAFSGPAKPGEEDGRGPMTFWGAAMFQWINAKGWVIVIGTITAYAAIAQFPVNIAIQTLISLLVGTVSTVVWAFFGTALRPVLTSERLVRAFNILMAILLLASLYPVFMDA